MDRRIALRLFFTCSLVLLCACSCKSTAEVDNQKKYDCRYYSGTVEVSNSIVVESGALVYIDEGSEMSFTNGAVIDVRRGGLLRIMGTADNPVEFSAEEGDRISGGIVAESSDVIVRHARFTYCGVRFLSRDTIERSAVIYGRYSSVKLFSVEFIKSSVDTVIQLVTSRESVIEDVEIRNADVEDSVLRLEGALNVYNNENTVSNLKLAGNVTARSRAVASVILGYDEASFVRLDTTDLNSPLGLICSSLLQSHVRGIAVCAVEFSDSHFENCDVVFNSATSCVFTDCSFGDETMAPPGYEYARMRGSGNIVFLTSDRYLPDVDGLFGLGEWYVKSNDSKFVEKCRKRIMSSRGEKGEPQAPGRYFIDKIHDGLYRISL
ncbi:MAG: hypothetical protein U5N86_00855 [Planctomycetota bacterium]|nr:hypothetical protein [Planctomycetota bacterium]